MIPLAYIAAPCGAGSVADRRRNLARADALGAAVASLGYATLIPHRAIGQQIQPGYPDEAETPEIRQRCMEACIRALYAVWLKAGVMHVLLRPDGMMSAGVRAEVEYWRSMGGEAVFWTWPLDGELSMVRP